MRANHRFVAGLAAVAVAAGLGACGGDGDYENRPRPATPITVTAAVDADRVRVSPRSFGAGPVVFIISNQSGAEQRVTFETDELAGETGGIRRATRSIAPRSTAELQADPREGTYRLSAGATGIEPARIEVGRPRPSAQGELLLP